MLYINSGNKLKLKRTQCCVQLASLRTGVIQPQLWKIHADMMDALKEEQGVNREESNGDSSCNEQSYVDRTACQYAWMASTEVIIFLTRSIIHQKVCENMSEIPHECSDGTIVIGELSVHRVQRTPMYSVTGRLTKRDAWDTETFILGVGFVSYPLFGDRHVGWEIEDGLFKERNIFLKRAVVTGENPAQHYIRNNLYEAT